MFGELIEQPIPLPPSLVREGGEEKERGQSPLSKRLFPLMLGIYLPIMERGTKGVR